MQPISPHASKVECDSLVASGQVYGCAKPFRVEGNENNISVVSCEYI